MVQPTSAIERLKIVDIVRGFALLGVLIVNMYSFNMPPYGVSIQYEPFSSIDSYTDLIESVLVEGKFYSIFAMLFGLGFALQISRLKEREAPFKTIFIRRVLILLAIGILHSLLVWNGDILHIYAILGLVLFLFHNSKPKKILKWIIIILAIFYLAYTAIFVVVGIKSTGNPEERTEELQNELEKFNSRFEIFESGDFVDITKERFRDFIDAQHLGMILIGLLYILPMFLIGTYIVKRGILNRTERSIKTLREIFYWSLLIGVISIAVYVVCWAITARYEKSLAHSILKIAEVFSNLSIGLFYFSGLVLLFRKTVFQTILKPLAAVGRMALTNYLVQSIFFTTIFYGYGLGFLGQKSQLLLAVISIIFFIIQVLLSNLWLSYFKYGPFEWLWRSLTYKKLQPLKLENTLNSIK